MGHGQMKNLAIVIGFTGVCACAPPVVTPENVQVDMGQIETSLTGTCFANDTTPAVIETVTVQEIETAEVRDGDGRVTQPATFRTVTRQQILRERTDVRFETVCPPVYTREFVSTLQRALTVRGFYAGPITGTLDATTSAAIRRFQRIDGPDTGLLSIATARALGLVALDRDAL